MGPIAFYAPLKSPHHPVPSGERQMARNLMQLLMRDGVVPQLVSELRSFDKHGDGAVQAALLAQAEAEIPTLIAKGRAEGWALWATYHSYYKAPDLLGPTVSAALGIPYLSFEATRANKRLGGPWDAFEKKAQAACDAADVLFHFTGRDAVALRGHLKVGQQLVHLPPFLAQENLPTQAEPDASTLLVAGMMRKGDKLASYSIIAEALGHLTGDWQVEIAGDGPCRAEVEALMAPYGGRVRFLGQLDAREMAQAYERARVFFWPGVNEAFGMVYLEAQAHGVPVVAQDRPGVRDVVAAEGLVADPTPDALAAALLTVLNDDETHRQRAQEARDLVQNHHLLTAARQTVWEVLNPLMKET
ncbi:MAG: glycosyltransferase family 4 protein [Shimia sp.]|uniref:glycosyltransferase family 4 protein n=1 Tax=Shimia sp. TaxID=1954381 RepID=UPI0025E42F2A|nr:glycosyltransferase family 4 protein [Shimia sp.]MCH2067829.1 glycosyltransferase family 4 protein [Shimia sp.]